MAYNIFPGILDVNVYYCRQTGRDWHLLKMTLEYFLWLPHKYPSVVVNRTRCEGSEHCTGHFWDLPRGGGLQQHDQEVEPRALVRARSFSGCCDADDRKCLPTVRNLHLPHFLPQIFTFQKDCLHLYTCMKMASCNPVKD